jgi:hypothetical protein
MGVGGQRHATVTLPPGETSTPGTYCMGHWVGAKAGLDGWGKIPHQYSIPGWSRP